MINYKSYLFQFVSVIFSFLNVKLMLDYLGDIHYSTWLIILSVAGLVYTLDFGVGSSIRNKLAKHVAKRTDVKSQAMLIIAYYKLIMVFAVTFGMVAVAIGMLAHIAGWLDAFDQSSLVLLSILIFMDFVVRAHHPVFAGLQQPQSTNLALAAVQVVVFFSLYFVFVPGSYVAENGLWVVVNLVFGCSIVINSIMLIRLNQLVPFFSQLVKTENFGIGRRRAVSYLRRGFPFFLLQIQFAILGQVTLFFVYTFFSAEIVVEVSIADKVFAPAIIIATVIMYPFWSAYTVLIHRGEFNTVVKLLRRQEMISLLSIPVLLVSTLFYDDVLQLWLGRTVETSIFAFFAILKVFSIFLNSIYSYFMNGVGKLRPQIAVYGIGLAAAFPILYFGSVTQNIYVCLSVTPMILLVSALTQRHFVFKVELARQN